MKLRSLMLVAAVALLLISGTEPVVQAACNGFQTQTKPFAFETITVSNVSIGFTTATADVANYAVVTLETNPIRYRADGSAPTAAIGHLASAGTTLEVCGKSAIASFRMIRQGAADATAPVTYYKGE